MKRPVIVLLMLALFSTPVLAQVFSGQVTNEKGEALPFVALYLREISSGFITDDGGRFQTTLKAGTYTCEVSSLGYMREIMTLHIPQEGLAKNIILKERVYELREVSITRTNEDPARAVMRKAIACAPKYQTYVKSYTADTYLKGSGRLNHIPGILKLSKEVRTGADKYLERTFLLEEQRTVKYTAPSTWENQIHAYSNSFPDNIRVTIESTDANLYLPRIFGKISPLSKGAFSLYDFKLEGCFTEGGRLINKIRIIPKKDNPELVSGTLYIVEDLWCISALDLTVRAQGITANIRVTCKEVKPGLFLSTSLSMANDIELFGLKAEASYLSAIKYLDITLADSIPANTRKHKYENPSRLYHANTDSLAANRDSIYWETVRTVPLRPEEVESYAYKEKLAQINVAGKRDTTKSLPQVILGTILKGRTIHTKDGKMWLRFNDLLSYIPEYNFVDGLWLGARGNAGMKFGKSTSLQGTAYGYYTTSRKEWVWGGELTLDYAPRRMGKLSAGAGQVTADFNGETGESRLENSLSSLLLGKNYIKLYERSFLNVRNEVELFNSLKLTTGLSWERRITLENTVSRSLFKKKALSNIPGNEDYRHTGSNLLLQTDLALEYTPAHYYRMVDGRKHYENSDYPTITVAYKRAFPYGGERKRTASFHRLELSLNQDIGFGFLNSLKWFVNAGTMFDKKDLYFSDFKHFAATDLFVTRFPFDRCFSLINNYEYSTSNRWVQAHLTWTSPYLLIKRLPLFEDKFFDEALHLRTLLVDGRKPYSEVGYSIGLPETGRVGVFAGFDRLKCRSVGVSVSLHFAL